MSYPVHSSIMAGVPIVLGPGKTEWVQMEVAAEGTYFRPDELLFQVTPGGEELVSIEALTIGGESVFVCPGAVPLERFPKHFSWPTVSHGKPIRFHLHNGSHDALRVVLALKGRVAR